MARSEKKAIYMISIVDSAGRQIGREEFDKPMNRSEAYSRLLKYLNGDIMKNDPTIAGGYVKFVNYV